PTATIFPYTTLFRSERRCDAVRGRGIGPEQDERREVRADHRAFGDADDALPVYRGEGLRLSDAHSGRPRTVRQSDRLRAREVTRSEEHTSELQSREN